MGLDLTSFIDNSLAQRFAARPYDVERGRELLVAGLKRTYDQLDHHDPKDKRRWARVSNGVVALTVQMEGAIVPVAGNATNYVPQAQFRAFMAALIGLVKRGDYDETLTEAMLNRKGKGAKAAAQPGAAGERLGLPAPEAPEASEAAAAPVADNESAPDTAADSEATPALPITQAPAVPVRADFAVLGAAEADISEAA